MKRRNMLPMAKVLVASKATAFAKTGELVGTGSALNITDGQLGVMSTDFYGTKAWGEFLAGGETADQVRAIRIVQGTPVSANTYNADIFTLGDKSHVETADIEAGKVRSLTVVKPKIARAGTYVMTDVATPLDSSEYGLTLELESNRGLRDYGGNDEYVSAFFATPDFTAVPAIVDSKDYLLKNILHKLNTESALFTDENGQNSGTKAFVALGINVAGGPGTALGTIVEGDQVPVFTYNGVTTMMPVSGDIVGGLAEAIAEASTTTPITAATTIVAYDVDAAGLAAEVDGILVVGLTRGEARGIDTNMSKVTTVKGNPKNAFRVTAGFQDQTIRARDVINSGKNWSIENRRRSQRTVYNMYAATDYAALNMSEGANYVSPDGFYISAIIDHFSTNQENITDTQQHEKMAQILFPAAFVKVDVATAAAAITAGDEPWDAIVTFDGVTPQAALVADFQATIQAWVTSSTGANVQSEL